MIKKDDKDAIIEFLKSRLRQIANRSLSWQDRPNPTVFERDMYCMCPECECEWDEHITVSDEAKKLMNTYVKQSAFDNLKLIAENALNEVTF